MLARFPWSWKGCGLLAGTGGRSLPLSLVWIRWTSRNGLKPQILWFGTSCQWWKFGIRQSPWSWNWPPMKWTRPPWMVPTCVSIWFRRMANYPLAFTVGGCRPNGFSDALMRQRGIYAQLIQLSTSDGPAKYRHLHPTELGLLNGFIPPASCLADDHPSLQLGLCAAGQLASPLQAIWAGGCAMKHLQQVSGMHPIDPAVVLGEYRCRMFQVAKDLFHDLPIPTAMTHMVEIQHLDGTIVHVHVSATATLAHFCQAEAELTQGHLEGQWCDAHTQEPVAPQDVVAGRCVRVLQPASEAAAHPLHVSPLFLLDDALLKDIPLDFPAEDHVRVASVAEASEVGVTACPVSGGGSAVGDSAPAVPEVHRPVPPYPVDSVAPDILFGLKSLNGAQLAALVPPLVRDVQSCRHLRQAAVSSVSRLDVLHKERSCHGGPLEWTLDSYRLDPGTDWSSCFDVGAWRCWCGLSLPPSWTCQCCLGLSHVRSGVQPSHLFTGFLWCSSRWISCPQAHRCWAARRWSQASRYAWVPAPQLCCCCSQHDWCSQTVDLGIGCCWPHSQPPSSAWSAASPDHVQSQACDPKPWTYGGAESSYRSFTLEVVESACQHAHARLAVGVAWRIGPEGDCQAIHQKDKNCFDQKGRSHLPGLWTWIRPSSCWTLGPFVVVKMTRLLRFLLAPWVRWPKGLFWRPTQKLSHSSRLATARTPCWWSTRLPRFRPISNDSNGPPFALQCVGLWPRNPCCCQVCSWAIRLFTSSVPKMLWPCQCLTLPVLGSRSTRINWMCLGKTSPPNQWSTSSRPCPASKHAASLIACVQVGILNLISRKIPCWMSSEDSFAMMLEDQLSGIVPLTLRSWFAMPRPWRSRSSNPAARRGCSWNPKQRMPWSLILITRWSGCHRWTFPWPTVPNANSSALELPELEGDLAWDCRPLQPLRGMPGGLIWAVQAVTPPPSNVLSLQHDQVVITSQDTKPPQGAEHHVLGPVHTVQMRQASEPHADETCVAIGTLHEKHLIWLYVCIYIYM